MNKLTPNELKELAEVVWPDKEWEIEGNWVIDIEDSDGVPWPILLEPHKTTERGKAQLCDVILATSEELCLNGDGSLQIKLINRLGIKNIDGALRLAHDVLIKKGE